MRLWTVIALLWMGMITYSQEPFSVVQQRLANAKVFAFGRTGAAGITSEGEKDFKTIMSFPVPRAIETFEKLYATGNPQAKSYALAGLRKLDRARFSELRKSLRISNLKVQTENGCRVSEQLLRDVATDLDSGKYDHWVR